MKSKDKTQKFQKAEAQMRSYYSKEESDISEESSDKYSSKEEEHKECVLMDFSSRDELDLEDREIGYEGELISSLNELSKARNRNKLLKEEIHKLNENKSSLVDNSLRTQLHELEKLKGNFLQKIVIQQNNLFEMEKGNESLKKNIGALIVCTHEEYIIFLKRELEEEKIRKNVLTNQLEGWKESFHKLEVEIVALRTNLPKVETKACLIQKFVKGSETLQNILSMPRLPEKRNSLGFKPSLQNVKDQPSTNYADVLKGK